MRSLLLKVAATALTMAAAAAATIHVSGHVRSAWAPLHPAVVDGAAATAGAGGRLHLTPSVQSADVQAVTSTAAS